MSLQDDIALLNDDKPSAQPQPADDNQNQLKRLGLVIGKRFNALPPRVPSPRTEQADAPYFGTPPFLGGSPSGNAPLGGMSPSGPQPPPEFFGSGRNHPIAPGGGPKSVTGAEPPIMGNSGMGTSGTITSALGAKSSQPTRPVMTGPPSREDYPARPELGGWKKALGLGLAALSGSPQVTEQILHGQRDKAERDYQNAVGEWNEKQASDLRSAQIQNVQSEIQARQNPKPEKPENLDREAYDFYIQGGMTPAEARKQVLRDATETKPDKPAKHSSGDIKLDEGIPTGVYGDADKLWRANDPNMPPELKAALGDAQSAHKQKFNEQLQAAREGRAVMAGSKAVNMITSDGRLVAVNGEDLPRFMKENPGSVEAGAGAGTQAMNRQALIGDIRASAQNVSKNLAVLDRTGFDRAKLAAALADPSTTSEAYLQAIPRNSLDDTGQQFVSDLFNLREQAMAMRSVLGAGQGSEDMRRAILQTLPGVGSGSSKFGKKQIDNLLSVLDRLERGIPQAPMRPAGAPQPNLPPGWN